ncbi:hypothetical protein FSW04_18875 [Baekduia soli]|uniref:Uncharacterized protein n=1 Tax=Baekduia soli TaxID=496014 RepID=A0A5B8U8V1_9ACTN|nr:hypothetical protein [Baekduia soli]QEC49430.1 hypothetical protein FSW04_18875 [Baekduia soli]
MTTLEREAVDGYEEITEASAPALAVSATEVRDWLADRLADGEMGASVLVESAAAAGISESQLRHARQRLGVVVSQRQRQWWWRLPEVVDESIPPSVAHAPARYRRDWLPAGTGVDWIEALRVRHVEAADAWAWASHEQAAVTVLRGRAETAFAEQVKDALRAGDAAPARPADLDPVVLAGRMVVAREVVAMVADALGTVIVDALGSFAAGAARSPTRRCRGSATRCAARCRWARATWPASRRSGCGRRPTSLTGAIRLSWSSATRTSRTPSLHRRKHDVGRTDHRPRACRVRLVHRLLDGQA